MGFLDQIVATLADWIDSLVDAAVLRPPVGLLFVTLAILAASVLPEGKRAMARMAALSAAGLLVIVKVLGPTGWNPLR